MAQFSDFELLTCVEEPSAGLVSLAIVQDEKK